MRQLAAKGASILGWVLCLEAAAQETKPDADLSWLPVTPGEIREYTAYRATSEITIDGKLDEAAWKDAPRSPRFVDIISGQETKYATSAAVVWDDAFLYVGFEIEEPDVQARLTRRDAPIYTENDVEVFIAGVGGYYEFEINALGTLYEAFFVWKSDYESGGFAADPVFRRDGPGVINFNGVGFKTHPRGLRIGFMRWDFPGLRSAVQVDGTLNDDSDQDKGWSVELAFPWKSAGMSALARADQRAVPPKSGDIWRMDFSRFNKKKYGEGDSGGWFWSRHGVWDSHIPECFVRVTFSEKEAKRGIPEKHEEGSHKKGVGLTPKEIDRSKPWALQPIVDPPPPEVAANQLVQSPIDRFVLANLEKAGLAPVGPADQRTLIRRVSFGLTGLPPTPEEIEAFLADGSPDAFAKLVDRLLASPAYGERWGRHWLDVARYGDCNGADESKPFPNAYRYRNYVIDAFNRDLPFDQFVKHQIAGDLLDPSADHRGLHPLIGTGFLVLGTKIVAEKDAPKMFADLVDEQIDTLGRAFMGMSLGCARCHDHKFDPVSTRDYYALAGIFHSTRTMASVGQWLERPLESPAIRLEKQEHQEEVAALEAKLKERRDEATEALAGSESAIEFEAETFARGNLVIDTDRYGVGIGIIGDVTAEADWAEWDVTIAAAGDHIVQFRYAAAVARPGRILLNGVEVKATAVGQITGGWMPAHQRWFTEGVFPFVAGVNVLRFENPAVMSHLDKVRILPVSPETERFFVGQKEIERLEDELGELRKQAPQAVSVMAVEEGEVHNVKVHLRGSHLQLGDEVPRRFLEAIAIGGADQEAVPDDQSGRLQLAEWLTDPHHPLTARVIVNRVWRWHFGEGLVRTPNNFGVRGEAPTHPELLDNLASQFMRDGWSLKALHRRILNSGTYQRSSVNDSAAVQADPENRLLWKFNRQRLEAEAIRDAVLTVAGQLDRQTGGAPLTLGTYNLSPADLEKNRKFYESSLRRSVYLPVLRTNVYEFLTLFDFSNPDFTDGHRIATTVPTQALLMMNSEMYALRAGQAAERLLSNQELADDQSRLQHAYLTFFARPAELDEIERAVAFLQAYRTTAEKVSEQEAWAALCQTFLASNEFVYLN